MAAANWRSMSDQDKEFYERKRQQNNALGDTQPIDASQCFPCGGDDFFPLNLQHADFVGSHIGQLAQKWTDTVGDCIIPRAEDVDAPIEDSCATEFGRGFCKDDLHVARLKDIRRRLCDFYKSVKPGATKFDRVWEPLVLIYFGPAEVDAGDDAGDVNISGRAALMLDIGEKP